MTEAVYSGRKATNQTNKTISLQYQKGHISRNKSSNMSGKMYGEFISSSEEQNDETGIC